MIYYHYIGKFPTGYTNKDLLKLKMATINTTGFQSGYDYKFIKEPPDDLKCLICLCVARDPQQHGDGGCGKIFCTNCISRYKRTKNKCPYCRRNITTFKDERSKPLLLSIAIMYFIQLKYMQHMFLLNSYIYSYRRERDPVTKSEV